MYFILSAARLLLANLYPADLQSGLVIGPPNGRVYLQNGQYWAVDSFGQTWFAQRVR
jgi:hypothetical protein